MAALAVAALLAVVAAAGGAGPCRGGFGLRVSINIHEGGSYGAAIESLWGSYGAHMGSL